MTDTAAPKPFKKGYKYRLYPTPEQRQYLLGLFGANRFLWNHVLDMKQKEYQQYLQDKKDHPDAIHIRPELSGYHLHSLIPGIKEQFEWMRLYSNVAYQQTLTALAEAYTRFLKAPGKVGHPRFKSKRNHQSVRLTRGGFSLRGGKFTPAKMAESIEVLWSRDLPSEPSSCTLSMTPSGEFYVSFLCEVTPPKTTGTAITGIDFGLKDLVTLSSGEKVTNPRHYTRAQRKLYLTRSCTRVSRGKAGPRTPSRFLLEIPDELIEVKDLASEAKEAVPTDEIRSFFSQFSVEE